MNLNKALQKYILWEKYQDRDFYYEPGNPKRGLCVNCENELFKKGFNQNNCEYHYLKKKYTTINYKCRLANKTKKTPSQLKYLKGIKCNVTWKEFLVWCISNKEYKRMAFPRIVRINKKKHFELNNIIWLNQGAKLNS